MAPQGWTPQDMDDFHYGSRPGDSTSEGGLEDSVGGSGGSGGVGLSEYLAGGCGFIMLAGVIYVGYLAKDYVSGFVDFLLSH